MQYPSSSPGSCDLGEEIPTEDFLPHCGAKRHFGILNRLLRCGPIILTWIIQRQSETVWGWEVSELGQKVSLFLTVGIGLTAIKNGTEMSEEQVFQKISLRKSKEKRVDVKGRGPDRLGGFPEWQ